MRFIVLPLILMASLVAGAAHAATAYGPFAFDRATRTLFVNGDAYYLPEGMGTSRLRGAKRVEVTWQQQGDRRVVTRYSAERDDNER